MNKVSTVYGPVDSWRLGRSLGVDLLCVASVCSFRCVYCQLGRLAIQTMLTPLNADSPEEFARVLNEIRPDEVHLCAPTRPVPRGWVADARGNLSAGGARLKQLTPEQVASFARVLVTRTGLNVFARRPQTGGV